MDLDALARRIRRCRKCRLHAHRTHAVPGVGPAPAPLMMVGEAPGRLEDESGEPFVGQAGAYLDRLLADVGIDRADVFVTSALKCRPPKNRPPRVDELTICGETWMSRQLAAVDPQIVVVMGQAAVRQLLGEVARMTDVHGQTRTRDGRTYLLTYHPAAGMRFPQLAAEIRRDFAKLGRLARSAGIAAAPPPRSR